MTEKKSVLRTKDEIEVAAQTWFWVQVELTAW